LHIVTVSEWLRGVAEQSFFGGKADIRCIYNGINTEVFSPVESDLRKTLHLEDKFVVLGVSSVWKNAKGLQEFIKLAERADANTAVVLVGVSEEQKKSLPASVIGVTAVADQRELAQYYSMADVLVNLSAEETFGLVVAEALACGTPAVVVNSTACPEVVDAETGLVIEAGTADCAMPALDLIRQRGKAAYSDACVARAGRLFSNERMQEEYLNLYRGIMKS
jgi:glycosyltransferase involved in cell wall biosynthesis